MTNKEAREWLEAIKEKYIHGGDEGYDEKRKEALDIGIKALAQEPCDDVCEWFEQYVDIATDIVELRFSDGTVKRAKRGLYMRDIEKSIRKMLIDQVANEKKQEPCTDCISRQDAIDEFKNGTEWYDFANWCRIDIIEVLEGLPSVTPAPRMGRWIEDDEEMEVYCSECGEVLQQTLCTNYCPHCGAKMDEVEDD